MESINCHSCSSKIKASSKFCPRCGIRQVDRTLAFSFGEANDKHEVESKALTNGSIEEISKSELIKAIVIGCCIGLVLLAIFIGVMF